MKTIFRFIVIFFIFATRHVIAQNYYVSSRGSDNADGRTPETAWKTLQKLESVSDKLQPGDSVLLERGSSFFGTLAIRSSGKTQQPIYVGAYGKGSRPVVTGSKPQRGWKSLENNLWVTTCDSCVEMPGDLFIDGKIQPLGRFPNKGYRTVTSGKKGSFIDGSTGLLEADWRGAELVVKTRRWLLDRLPVNDYRNATFNVDVPKNYEQQEKSFYFIQNHPATLDAPGEWCYDARDKKLYLYALRQGPAKSKVEISVVQRGLVIDGQHDVTIEEIDFVKFTELNVQIRNSTNVIFRNAVVSFAGDNGVAVTGCTSILLEKSTVRDIHNNGVVWDKNTNGIFRQNHILATGVTPGRGRTGDGNYIGLFVKGETRDKKNVIEKNVIDSIGYSAIDFRTGSTTIKNNLISNFCLIKDDGGGIYTWTNTHGNNTVEENIILGRLKPNSTSFTDQTFVYGIYIDDRSRNIVVAKNTVAYCAVAGIFIHNANTLQLSENTLVGNGENPFHQERGQLLLRRDNLASEAEWDIHDLNVHKNRFVCSREDQYAIYFNFYRKQSMAVGKFVDNEYQVMRPSAIAAMDGNPGTANSCAGVQEFSLAEWHEKTGADRSATFHIIKNRAVSTRGINLVQNGDMTDGVQLWTIWPGEASIAQDLRAMKNPSLRVDIDNDSTSVLLYYAGLRLKPNVLYRLAFSVKGSEPADMEFVTMMAQAPYKALTNYRCIKINPSENTHVFYFNVRTQNQEARLNFKSNVSFWLDNVTLEEVSPSRNENEGIRLVYNASEKLQKLTLGDKSTLTLQPYSSKVITN